MLQPRSKGAGEGKTARIILECCHCCFSLMALSGSKLDPPWGTSGVHTPQVSLLNGTMLLILFVLLLKSSVNPYMHISPNL